MAFLCYDDSQMITSTVNHQSRYEPDLRAKLIFLAGICATAVLLLGIPSTKTIGWLLLSWLALGLLIFKRSIFARDMLLLLLSLSILGLTPINTNVSTGHILLMGGMILSAVALPFAVTRFVFKERIMQFPFWMGRAWTKREILYVFIAVAIAYFMFPYYFFSTGSYLNWTVELDAGSLVRLFIGTNGLGIWDELFFIGTALALMKRHVPFHWANIAQATLFATFLYELGFHGWGPVAVFIFALTQGYIFQKSKAFSYILTIHLAVDLVLYLVLIHLHHPHLLRIFLVSPV